MKRNKTKKHVLTACLVPSILLPALHTLTHLLLKLCGEFFIITPILKKKLRLSEVK